VAHRCKTSFLAPIFDEYTTLPFPDGVHRAIFIPSFLLVFEAFKGLWACE
jgi:hypothetical protein